MAEMTTSERDDFLGEVRVGVLAIERDAKGPLCANDEDFGTLMNNSRQECTTNAHDNRCVDSRWRTPIEDLAAQRNPDEERSCDEASSYVKQHDCKGHLAQDPCIEWC